jgi:hypothetical protein
MSNVVFRIMWQFPHYYVVYVVASALIMRPI